MPRSARSSALPTTLTGRRMKRASIKALEAPPRVKPSNYPEPFASRMAGREKRPLGDLFGLANFGVNLTRLAPGAVSALRHSHLRQDEFVYVIEGHPTLVTDAGETQLAPGMCAGFKAGSGCRGRSARGQAASDGLGQENDRAGREGHPDRRRNVGDRL